MQDNLGYYRRAWSLIRKELRKKKWQRFVVKNGMTLTTWEDGFCVNLRMRYKYSRSVDLGAFEDFVDELSMAIEKTLKKKNLNYWEVWCASSTEITFTLKE